MGDLARPVFGRSQAAYLNSRISPDNDESEFSNRERDTTVPYNGVKGRADSKGEFTARFGQAQQGRIEIGDDLNSVMISIRQAAE